jgi:phospho-N-acetylmuramoyl-pentapeptide-transferase
VIAVSWELLARGMAVLVGAMAVGALLAAPILWLLRLLRSRQEVSEFAPEGHRSKQGTPTMGGLIVLAGVGVAMALHRPLADWLIPNDYSGTVTYVEVDLNEIGPLWAWFALVGSFALIGFLDDFAVPRMMKGKRGLGWIPKLILQFGAAWFAVPAVGAVPQFTIYLELAVIVLFFANAYNFADGLDGLAGGLGVVLFGTLAVWGLLIHLGEPTLWAFAAVGGLVPFLFLNAPPARVFMGDVGSLPLGALVGAFVAVLIAPLTGVWAVEYRYGDYWFWIASGMPGSDFFDRMDAWRTIPALALLCLVLIVEIVPVPLQILSVKLLKRRIFPMTPIHHAFEKRGWPESKIVWTFVLAQLALALLAIAVLLPAVSQDASIGVVKGQPRRLGP